MKKRRFFYIAAMAALAITACGPDPQVPTKADTAQTVSPDEESAEAASQEETEKGQIEKAEEAFGQAETAEGAAPPETEEQAGGEEAKAEGGGQEEADSQLSTATIYIVGADGSYEKFPLQYGGVLEPDALIQGIARETGWNLDLAEPVISGKAGMTVTFADSCSIFTGPPEEQKEEYFVYDGIQLAQAILDSITYTLQNNYVDVSKGGDPKNLGVWFEDSEYGPIELPNYGIIIDNEKPYTSWEDVQMVQ